MYLRDTVKTWRLKHRQFPIPGEPLILHNTYGSLALLVIVNSDFVVRRHSTRRLTVTISVHINSPQNSVSHSPEHFS